MNVIFELSYHYNSNNKNCIVNTHRLNTKIKTRNMNNTGVLNWQMAISLNFEQMIPLEEGALYYSLVILFYYLFIYLIFSQLYAEKAVSQLPIPLE